MKFYLEFEALKKAKYKQNYKSICDKINILAEYNDVEKLVSYLRELAKTDLFFLLYFILDIKAINHPWIIDRINEIETDHNQTLDLWSREHWKSTLLTYALPIQKILCNPEERIGIFSHKKAISKAFLHRIKTTLENNDLLKFLFPDILFRDPRNEAPKWSADDGLIVRRTGVYNEATVESCGFVDGMPTSKHYTIRIYDDIVTQESVTTPEQIRKTDEAWKLSQFLKARGGLTWMAGTRYHFADQYQKIIDSQMFKVRVRRGVEPNGKTYLMTKEELEEFKKIVCEGSTYVYNCQMLLNPVAEEAQEFKREWLRYYRTLPETLNYYLFIDPANAKKKTSDYTVMWLWGLDPLGNYFLVDMIRERLNLTERWKHLKAFMMRYPSINKVLYEKYGMQADVDHFKSRMLDEGVYFLIEELGGKVQKLDRIRKLIPLFENGKVYLPEALYSRTDGRDLVKEFIEEEYLLFPYSAHDDMLDAASRVKDPEAEVFKPMEFPLEDEDYENVINLNNWAFRKAQSRYANC